VKICVSTLTGSGQTGTGDDEVTDRHPLDVGPDFFDDADDLGTAPTSVESRVRNQASHTALPSRSVAVRPATSTARARNEATKDGAVAVMHPVSVSRGECRSHDRRDCCTGR
jgi:hypothetical protein